MKYYIEKTIFILKVQPFGCMIAYLNEKRARITEVHHRMHDTKTNRKLYPNFIDSIFNLWGVNHNWHMKFPFAGKINERTANAIESYLLEYPSVSEWANSVPRITEELLESFYKIARAFELGGNYEENGRIVHGQ